MEAAFRLFVEVWERTRLADPREEDISCDTNDHLYLEEIADDVLKYDEEGYEYFDWERANEILEEFDYWSGARNPVVRTWVVVLAYFLTDYQYLFL